MPLHEVQPSASDDPVSENTEPHGNEDPMDCEVAQPSEDLEYAELLKKYEDLNTQHKTLQENNRKSTHSTQKLKQKIQTLNEEFQRLQENIRFLNEDQIRSLSRENNFGHTWSTGTIKQALQIKYACGTSGYEFLRKLGYPLPSTSVLGRRLQGLKFLPGVLTEVFDVLKSKADTMDDVEKDCALYLDEMEMAPGYEHDRGEDCFLGGVTLPDNLDNPGIAANHACVFMLGGLNSRWKQVVAYHFTGRSIDPQALKDVVFEIIQLAFECSLRVLVVTSDMGPANRGLWHLLGLSSHRLSVTVCSVPHPHLDGRLLYFMPDAAHVLKNIRGQFLNSHTFTLGEDTVKLNHLPSATVNVDHVTAVLDFDEENELKIAPRLSDIHTSTGHFTKMKVGIAVQLFRESPPAIRYLIRQKKLPAEAETTAWFMQLVSKWYSLMSARHPKVALSHLDMHKHNRAVQTLKLAVDTFLCMKMGNTNHWKPSQAGVVSATHVVLQLQEQLLCDDRYKFFLTGRLTQDCVENLFSVVRIRKPLPTAYDVKCTLKLISVSQFLHTPRSSGYEEDDREYLADLLLHSARQGVTAEPEQIRDIENIFAEKLSIIEGDILSHIGGFILKALIHAIGDCGTCRSVLIGNSESQYGALTSLREYVEDETHLVYPTHDVMNVLCQSEELFKSISASGRLMGLNAPLKTLAAVLHERFSGYLDTCEDHKEKVDRLLLDSFSRIRLRIYLKQMHKGSASSHSSKTCASVQLS